MQQSYICSDFPLWATGEPLLYPKIENFLREIAPSTEVIHIFTSYQFNRRVMERFSNMDLPEEKIILNHTPIYFEPERWKKLTRGFPFEIYLDNVRKAAQLPIRKRFKFIINHSQFGDEVARFQELVQPNESCEISFTRRFLNCWFAYYNWSYDSW